MRKNHSVHSFTLSLCVMIYKCWHPTAFQKHVLLTLTELNANQATQTEPNQSSDEFEHNILIFQQLRNIKWKMASSEQQTDQPNECAFRENQIQHFNVISKSIGRIIRNTQNEQFKSNASQMLNIKVGRRKKKNAQSETMKLLTNIYQWFFVYDINRIHGKKVTLSFEMIWRVMMTTNDNVALYKTIGSVYCSNLTSSFRRMLRKNTNVTLIVYEQQRLSECRLRAWVPTDARPDPIGFDSIRVMIAMVFLLGVDFRTDCKCTKCTSRKIFPSFIFSRKLHTVSHFIVFDLFINC